MWIAWTLTTIALGLVSTLLATDSLGKSATWFCSAGAQYVVYVDRGLSWSISILTHGSILQTTPSHSSTPPVMLNVPALSFMWFLRSFAMVTISSSSVIHSHVPSVVGTIIGSIVLRNELARRLPALFIHSAGNPSMYALVPELSKLSPPISFEVQAAFAGSRCCGKSALPIVAQDS